jgi:large subunit ribosomal protein L29
MATGTGGVDTSATPTAEELRGLADDELVTKLREAKEELFNLRFQVATGQLDNNRRLSAVRRDIARIYTVMRQRELGIGGLPTGATTTTVAAP